MMHFDEGTKGFKINCTNLITALNSNLRKPQLSYGCKWKLNIGLQTIKINQVI